MVKLLPLHDKVVVRPQEAEERSPGGIMIPDAVRCKPTRGEVMAAGPGRFDQSGKRIAMGVKAGDVVIYSEYAGTEVEVERVRYRIFSESEILAVLEK